MATKMIPDPPRSVPITPSVERWRAMTPAERESLLIEVNDALTDQQILLPEGRPHKKAKTKAMDMLGLHFRAMGRRIYLAEEMSVLYPLEAPFSPDILAVLDVEEPEDDQRMAWVVADEGKGIDWVLEVLWAGDRKKDLVDNVERYARLGIQEYFVYDRRNQRIHGYRLEADATRYQPILAQGGLYRSKILGVDLAVVKDSLRFFQGSAELFDTENMINRLQGMVESLDARAEKAEHEAEKAQQDVQKAQQDAEKALVGVRSAIVAILTARGVTCSKDALSRIEACADPERLGQWLSRAMGASSEASVFSTEQD